MLQIIIVHESDSLYISEIRDLETMQSLSTYDKEKRATDLSCLESHTNESILVTHFVRNGGCTRLDYEQERTLTEVGTDANGFMYVQYN